jgi:hypothetical protein
MPRDGAIIFGHLVGTADVLNAPKQSRASKSLKVMIFSPRAI